jgi:hypothetical protein
MESIHYFPSPLRVRSKSTSQPPKKKKYSQTVANQSIKTIHLLWEMILRLEMTKRFRAEAFNPFPLPPWSTPNPWLSAMKSASGISQVTVLVVTCPSCLYWWQKLSYSTLWHPPSLSSPKLASDLATAEPLFKPCPQCYGDTPNSLPSSHKYTSEL